MDQRKVKIAHQKNIKNAHALSADKWYIDINLVML